MQSIYKKASIIAILVGITLVIVSLCLSIRNQKREIKRLSENYETEMSGSTSYQQTLTKQEMKKLLKDELNTLKDFGVVARNIENIIEVRYEYRDSVRYRDTLVWVYDTVRLHRIADVCVNADCYYIDGKIFDDTIEIFDAKFKDDILISLYREKRKCLFGKQKVKAVAVSSCSGDTLKIERNIAIRK